MAAIEIVDRGVAVGGREVGRDGDVQVACGAGRSAVADMAFQLERTWVAAAAALLAGTRHGLELGGAHAQRTGLEVVAERLEGGGLAAHGVEVGRRALEGLVEGAQRLPRLAHLQVDVAHRDEGQRPFGNQFAGLLVVVDGLAGTALHDGHVTTPQRVLVASGDGSLIRTQHQAWGRRGRYLEGPGVRDRWGVRRSGVVAPPRPADRAPAGAWRASAW